MDGDIMTTIHKPLSLEELEKMDGKAVWITDTNGENGLWGLVIYVQGSVNPAYGLPYYFGTYGYEWQAYTAKHTEKIEWK